MSSHLMYCMGESDGVIGLHRSQQMYGGIRWCDWFTPGSTKESDGVIMSHRTETYGIQSRRLYRIRRMIFKRQSLYYIRMLRALVYNDYPNLKGMYNINIQTRRLY